MTKWIRSKVAATIDHAVLKPNMTDQDIIDNCQMGRKFQVASVCVRPGDVALAAKELEGSGVPPSVVVGFPHGAHRPETKALEARLAIQDGARELDMVMNVGKFLSGDCNWVKRDVEAVVAEAKAAGGIRSYDTAVGYLEQGCKRLGAGGGTAAIIDEAPEDEAGE